MMDKETIIGIILLLPSGVYGLYRLYTAPFKTDFKPICFYFLLGVVFVCYPLTIISDQIKDWGGTVILFVLWGIAFTWAFPPPPDSKS